ncbi:hypothetical protein VTI74DRAFT_4740 [Chaetomium olivicolor]
MVPLHLQLTPSSSLPLPADGRRQPLQFPSGGLATNRSQGGAQPESTETADALAKRVEGLETRQTTRHPHAEPSAQQPARNGGSALAATTTPSTASDTLAVANNKTLATSNQPGGGQQPRRSYNRPRSDTKYHGHRQNGLSHRRCIGIRDRHAGRRHT